MTEIDEPLRLPPMQASSVREYCLGPIPDIDDDGIRSFVRGAVEARRRYVFSDEEAWRLLSFAERTASLAVRLRSAEYIADGLGALTLEGGRVDLAESIVSIALLYDATMRIGSDVHSQFRKYAQMMDNRELGAELDGFPTRPAENRTIEAMGYKVIEDAGGFRYWRRW